MIRFLLPILLVLTASPAGAVRVQELCEVRGARANQLIGYGLVVGLRSTGDSRQARFTVQSVAAMLRRLGATVDPQLIQTRNAAAVVVTATLPAFARPGTRIDVTVSSLGDARSLEGGTLLQAPLTAGDRRIYAVAQGALLIGGFSAGGRTGSQVQQNHTTVGRVPEGAIVERPIDVPIGTDGTVVLTLRAPSFVTASRIAEAVNGAVGENSASAVDAGAVRITVPEDHRNRIAEFLSGLQLLDVQPDAPARVVIDERTGTIVLGAGVRISEVAIAQGGLTVEVTERRQVSQPGPFGRGRTAVVPETDVQAQASGGAIHHLQPTASLAEVVAALNAVGARPRDLVSIFQGLRSAGALQAAIEVQ